MTEPNILINRAPALTLWATTVAERLGFDHNEALSLGKAVAGLTAQSKGLGQMRMEASHLWQSLRSKMVS
jgi:hypothetical protein